MKPKLIFLLLCAFSLVTLVLCAGEGNVRYYGDHRLQHDPWTNKAQNGDAQVKQFFLDFYDAMQVYTPSFDQKTQWYPNAFVYHNAYAIHLNNLQNIPNWQQMVLKDVNGAALYIPWGCYGGTCPAYAADIGSSAFRQYLLGTMHTSINGNNYQGIFMDDVALNYRVSYGDGSNAFPIDPRTGAIMTTVNWRKYFAEWMELIRSTFPALKIVHNAPWYQDLDIYFQRQIKASDYMMHERGINDLGLTAGAGTYGVDRYFEFNDYLHSVGVHGIDFNNDANTQTDTANELALAAYLMYSDGQDYVGSSWKELPNDLWPGFMLNFGDALGKREKFTPPGFSGYIWKREFTLGLAYFNPPGNPGVTITLPAFNGHYKNCYGDVVSTIWLGTKFGGVVQKIYNGNPPAPPAPPAPSSSPPPAVTIPACGCACKILFDDYELGDPVFWAGNGASYLVKEGSLEVDLGTGTWGILQISLSPSISLTAYKYVEFHIYNANGFAANDALGLKAGNDAGEEGDVVSVSTYTGGALESKWTAVKIPISDLKINGQLYYLVFIDLAFTPVPRRVYIDGLRLTNDCTKPCTPKGCEFNACGPLNNDGCGKTLDCGSCATGSSCVGNFCKANTAVSCAKTILLLQDNSKFQQSTFEQSIAKLLAISVDQVKVTQYKVIGVSLGVQFDLCGDTAALADTLADKLFSLPAAALANAGIYLSDQSGSTTTGTYASPSSIHNSGGSVTINSDQPLFSGQSYTVLFYKADNTLSHSTSGTFKDSKTLAFTVASNTVAADYTIDVVVSASPDSSVLPQPVALSVYDCSSKSCSGCLSEGIVCSWCENSKTCSDLAPDCTTELSQCPLDQELNTSAGITLAPMTLFLVFVLAIIYLVRA